MLKTSRKPRKHKQHDKIIENKSRKYVLIDTVFNLAFINGTDNFYNFPEKVLEVGVKGALNSIDAAIALGVKNYIVT